MTVVTGLTEYQARLRALPSRVQAVVLASLRGQEGTIVGYMRTQAPWQDRTGAARRLLRAWTTAAAASVTLTVAHGVSYGVFLELSNQGRFAILWQTLRTLKAQILQTVRAALQQAFGGQWAVRA